MLTPDQLLAYVQVMRTAGVAYLRAGELEIRLGAPDAPAPEHRDEADTEPRDVYDELSAPRLQRRESPRT